MKRPRSGCELGPQPEERAQNGEQSFQEIFAGYMNEHSLPGLPPY